MKHPYLSGKLVATPTNQQPLCKHQKLFALRCGVSSCFVNSHLDNPNIRLSHHATISSRRCLQGFYFSFISPNLENLHFYDQRLSMLFVAPLLRQFPQARLS